MEMFDFPAWQCSRCGYTMDTATSAQADSPEPPKERDIAVCFDCGELHIMHDAKFVPLTDDELIELPLDFKKYVARLQHRVRSWHKQEREKK